MNRTLSHSGRRACAQLLAKGYRFQTTVEGIAWWAPDLSSGCEQTLQLAVDKAKRHDNQVLLKKRLEVSQLYRALSYASRRQITARLPG